MDSSRVSDSVTISYVLPAHNSADIIEGSVKELSDHFAGTNAEILVVENGSTDGTLELVRKLESDWSHDVTLRVITTEKGIGNAFRAAIEASRGERICLDGDDLPFGLDWVDTAMKMDPEANPVIVASKAHPDSVVPRSPLRQIMTGTFQTLRRVILGMRTRDSQGAYVLSGPWARSVSAHLQETGFLITAEVAHVAERSGIRTVELPVRLRESHDSHGTRIRLSDPLKMSAGLFGIRRRHRHTTFTQYATTKA